MKRLVLALMALLLLSPSLLGPLFGQEPIKFRGAFVGEPLADFVDCSSGKGKLLKEGYKSHGKLCEGKKGVIWKTKIRGFLNTKADGEAFMFDGSKLFRIVIFIPDEDWEKARYDITEKMGPPASEVPQVFENGFGARWEYNQGFWSKGDTVVFAEIKVETIAGQSITSPFSNRLTYEASRSKSQTLNTPNCHPNTMD